MGGATLPTCFQRIKTTWNLFRSTHSPWANLVQLQNSSHSNVLSRCVIPIHSVANPRRNLIKPRPICSNPTPGNIEPRIGENASEAGHLKIGAIPINRKARIVQIRAFSCLKFGDPPRGRTENLLIKSQLVNLVFFSWLSFILPAKRYQYNGNRK